MYRLATSALLCLLLLGTVPAANAGSATDAEITDQTGDANHLSPLPDPDPTTAPASVAAVDLEKVWYTTRYVTVKDRDASGKVIRVRNVPDALIVTIRTAGPKRIGAFLGGYTLQFNMTSQIVGGCPLNLWLSINPETGATDKVQYRCTAGYVELPANSLTNTGVDARLTLPFATVPALADDLTLKAGTAADPTSIRAAWVLNSTADLATGGRDFVIGSDVPPDIDCLEDPANPVCA